MTTEQLQSVQTDMLTAELRRRGEDVVAALELAGTNALIDELKRRCSGLVLAFDGPGPTGETCGVDWTWNGASIAHAIGLAEYMVRRLDAVCEDLFNPVREDDE